MKKSLPGFVEKYANRDPELFKNVSDLTATAFAEGALDLKTKLLITLALDAVKGSATGVASVARQARSVGATDKEISEAIRLAYYVSGMQTLSAGNAAFGE